MNRLYKSLVIASAALLIGAMAMGQGRPPAPAAGNAPPPSRLAVANLVQLMYSLDEWNAFKQDLQKMQSGFTDEQHNREKALQDMQKELDNPTLFKKGSAEYKKMQDDFVMKGMDYQTFTQYVPQKLMLELRLKTSDMYRKIDSSIAAYAQANGIAVVLQSQDIDSFDSARSNQELITLVTERKVLYVHPDFDITKKLIEKMNAEYNTGRGTP